MKERIFKSSIEVERTCFPNCLLERLEQTLCDKLSLTKYYQHKLSKSNDNPKTGILEIANPPFFFESIINIVKSFYREEGYIIIKQEKNNTIEVKKENENYWINVICSDNSYTLWIIESPFKDVKIPSFSYS